MDKSVKNDSQHAMKTINPWVEAWIARCHASKPVYPWSPGMAAIKPAVIFPKRSMVCSWLLKNYCAWQCGVKIQLNMLIYQP
jgi:hypothetical protein